MTRDEAIAKVFPVMQEVCIGSGDERIREIAAGEVDMLVALGILTLEEPKTIEQRTADIVFRHTREPQAQCIMNALRKEGLL